MMKRFARPVALGGQWVRNQAPVTAAGTEFDVFTGT
jgi:hypothetical protein